MAIATQAIVIEKILTRHNFTEEEATKIIDYVENQKGDFATKQDIALVKQEIENIKQNISMLKWIVGLGFGGLLTIMLYLHNDTKQEMKEFKTEMKELKTEMKELKTEMRENQKLILQLIQKR